MHVRAHAYKHTRACNARGREREHERDAVKKRPIPRVYGASSTYTATPRTAHPPPLPPPPPFHRCIGLGARIPERRSSRGFPAMDLSAGTLNFRREDDRGLLTRRYTSKRRRRRRRRLHRRLRSIRLSSLLSPRASHPRDHHDDGETFFALSSLPSSSRVPPALALPSTTTTLSARLSSRPSTEQPRCHCTALCLARPPARPVLPFPIYTRIPPRWSRPAYVPLGSAPGVSR